MNPSVELLRQIDINSLSIDNDKYKQRYYESCIFYRKLLDIEVYLTKDMPYLFDEDENDIELPF